MGDSEYKEADYKQAIAVANKEFRLLNETLIEAAENHNITLEELKAAKAKIIKLNEESENMKQKSLSDQMTIDSLVADNLKLIQQQKDLINFVNNHTVHTQDSTGRTLRTRPQSPSPENNPEHKSSREARNRERQRRLDNLGVGNGLETTNLRY